MNNATEIPVNHYEPHPGNWIIFKNGKKYTENGHVGIVMSVDKNNRIMKIIESNFLKGQITVRVVSMDDPLIKGYFK